MIDGCSGVVNRGEKIVVTGDQDVMEEVGTRVWHLEGGTIHNFKGTDEEYDSAVAG